MNKKLADVVRKDMLKKKAGKELNQKHFISDVADMKDAAQKMKYVHHYQDPTEYRFDGTGHNRYKTISFEEALKLAGEDLWYAIDRAIGHLTANVKLDNGEEIEVDATPYRKG